MSNANIVAKLKEQAFDAAQRVKVDGVGASELGTKHMLLGGNGNYFSNEVLKPFVEALFTDNTAIDKAKTLLMNQARALMGTYKDEDRGTVLFGQLSDRQQQAVTTAATQYVTKVKSAVEAYVAKVPGTGAAKAQG